MTWDQITIALFGALAAWLSQTRTDRLRRWACIFGMLGQPGWFYAAWTAQQWGILVLCVIYCGAWMHGVWIHWIRPAPQGGGGVDTVTLAPSPRGASKLTD